MSIFHLIYVGFTYGILIFSILLIVFYLLIAIYSTIETKEYLQKCSFIDYSTLAGSNEAPPLSILAPAYNEGATIIENVKSLLATHYGRFEVIVINDGSKDDTLQKLIPVYELVQADVQYITRLPTRNVRAVYRSLNPIYKRLIVVDKENGGKADALNVGINIASNDIVVCIDVDCVLEQDAMLKLIRPFLETEDRRVIATGGVVRIANSCEVRDGKIVRVHLPKEFLPRMQTLEYIRAFLLGRMAWSRIDGLLLISGAFGAFDREIAINAGGYDHGTVGEDMELVVRMRRYMEERKLPYKVAYIPDPLCWTEAPNSFRILGRQRNRWTRGTIETLKIHRTLFFNRKYGTIGMLSYPYWFFFEFMAPLIEFVGFVGFAVFAALGLVDWKFVIGLFLFVYSFSVLYSVFAILMEVLTYNQYKKRQEVFKLLISAMVEPFLFHPFVVWSAVQGNIDLLRRKNSWGVMTRQGFSQEATAKT